MNIFKFKALSLFLMTTMSLTCFSQSVFDIIANSPDHTNLEAAIIAAELDATLSGEGTFTVFAPTDDAFSVIPPAVLDMLLADPTGDLTQILLYHVVGSTALSTALSTGMMIETLQGDEVMVTISDGVVKINDATVVIADLLASNGVVHVVDAVIQALPETVLEVVINSDSHNTLEAAVLAAGLDGALSNPDASLTVFAPTDDAFSVIPPAVLDMLLADPTGDLTQILLYHVVGSTALSTDLSTGMMIETLQGDEVMVTITNGVVKINDATVVVADILTYNGVVHVVDAVIENTTSSIDMIQDNNDEYYLYSVDLLGKIIQQDNNFNIVNQIVLDVYNTGKVVKRFSINN